ncbi:hypothetical protein ACFLUU_01260 [Chloroflexota bacterium]
MKKALLPVLALVLALGLALPMASPAVAHVESDPQTIALVAGQDEVVGNVQVWNDGNNLHVKYNITVAGWQLTETHLAVATAIADVPQTKKGNPKVGKFPYAEPDGDYTIELAWAPGTTLVIAAHAVVLYTESCDPPIVREETAWGMGLYCNGRDWVNSIPFEGSNWAEYFEYKVQ